MARDSGYILKQREERKSLATVGGKAKMRRSCLCCNQAFLSDGAHHRLCDPCRRKTPFEAFNVVSARRIGAGGHA